MICRQLISIGLLGFVLFALSGCVAEAEYKKCVRRNQIQQQRILDLEAAQERERLEADKLRQEFELYMKTQGYDSEKIAALQAALAAKQAKIDQLSSMVGQIALPAELSSALADWASKSGSSLVTYDEENGIVRFKSDLLFKKGDDAVQSSAKGQLGEFAKILNTSAAKDFDVLIVGHTDDVPILKPSTKAKHPSNWHLSAHRSISVQKVLASSGLAQTRMAVMGLGEFRPMEPNKAGNKGNPVNRRVEIYIVPAGHLRTVPN